MPCVSQTAYMRCDECIEEETCGVRLAMKEVRDATAHILDNTTLAGLSARVAASRRERLATPGPERRTQVCKLGEVAGLQSPFQATSADGSANYGRNPWGILVCLLNL